MALDFPDSPAVGDLYGSTDMVWRWNGSIWASTAGVSGAQGTVAYAQVTVQIGIGAGNTLYDLVSVTFMAVAGRRYKLTGKVFTTVGGSGGQSVAHIKTAAGATVGQDVSQSASTSGNTLEPMAVVTATVTGSVTYKLSIIQAAAGNAWGDPTDPIFLLVEDITFEAGSSGPSSGKAALGWLTTIVNTADYANITTEAATCSGQVDVVLGRKYYATIQQAFAQTVPTDTFLVATKMGGIKIGHHLSLQHNAWQVTYATSMVYTAVATGVVPCQITLARIAGTGTATSGGTTYLNTTMNIFDAGPGA